MVQSKILSFIGQKQPAEATHGNEIERQWSSGHSARRPKGAVRTRYGWETQRKDTKETDELTYDVREQTRQRLRRSPRVRANLRYACYVDLRALARLQPRAATIPQDAGMTVECAREA